MRFQLAIKARVGIMAYSQAKLDAARAAAAAAGACVVEEIASCGRWKAPAFFTCTSGVLLWGQLPTVMEGSLSPTLLDSAFGPYQPPAPGFDMNAYRLQHALHYRAPARRGLWKVESVGRIGYVCHHVDASGPDILRRAALVGVSRFESHTDRDIVFVNYGDWSNWGCPAAGSRLMAELLKPVKKKRRELVNPEPLMRRSDDDEYSCGSVEMDDEGEEDEEEWFGSVPETDEERDNATAEREGYEEALIMNRFMLVDEQGFPQLVQVLREGFKLHSRNYLFRDNNNNSRKKRNAAEPAPPVTQEPHPSPVSDAFGVNLCIDYDEDNDGELGWLAFQSGELVGFVYDGARCNLEGRHFRCGDVEVEVPREPTPDEDEFDSDSDEQPEEYEDGEDLYDNWNRSGKRPRR